MKIESIIKRKKGTTVKLGDMTYFFNATETEPRHLCEVNIQAHIDRFLSIKEGFRAAEGEKTNPAEEDTVLLGSSELPALVVIAEGKEIPLGDIVRGAFIVSNLTASDWNEQDDEDRENAIQDYVHFLIKQEEDANPAEPENKSNLEQNDEAANKPEESPAPVQTNEKPAELVAPAAQQQPAAGVEIDRNALLAEAKVLKIKSAHLFGNERLVQAVAAAKANG